MSDTADEPSGDDSEFDKEAEREKLREKLARDEEKRESTRRMSELLLKGATMTNDHCDACGSPIFRQNGREFCPQCDAVEGSPGAEGGATVADAGAANEGGTEPREPDAGTADATPDRSTATGHGPERQRSRDGQRASPTPETGARGTDGATAERGGDRAPGDRVANADRSRPAADAPQSPERSRSPEPSRSGSAVGDDLGAARDALATALRRHAEAGAEASDHRVAADHLDAAREAAEALSALRR